MNIVRQSTVELLLGDVFRCGKGNAEGGHRKGKREKGKGKREKGKGKREKGKGWGMRDGNGEEEGRGDGRKGEEWWGDEEPET
jgi:hypothetical protein